MWRTRSALTRPCWSATLRPTAAGSPAPSTVTLVVALISTWLGADLLQDGQRIPIPGRLYYRGIELNDIVEAHRAEGTFGFEEVAYLLLMGYLPSQGELRHFNEIMNRARKLPEGFTEGMIMRRTSGNIMNEPGRSILLL